MVNENLKKEETKETKPVDPMQVKADRFAGWVLIIFGGMYILSLFVSIYYMCRFVENISSALFMFIYSLIMIVVCIGKGKVLIKKAGGPAYTFAGDNRNWKSRLLITFVLIVFTSILISGLAGEVSIILAISLIPLLIVNL